MPSGKQVLLNLLQKYSQTPQKDSELEEATKDIQSALCAHCSTSGETMEKIIQMGWLSLSDKDGLVKQGLGLKKSNVFISDIFEELIEVDEMPERITKRFPNLTQKEYSTALDMIEWLLSSLQYWEELHAVENGGIIEESEKEKILIGYKRWLDSYKREPW